MRAGRKKKTEGQRAEEAAVAEAAKPVKEFDFVKRPQDGLWNEAGLAEHLAELQAYRYIFHSGKALKGEPEAWTALRTILKQMPEKFFERMQHLEDRWAQLKVTINPRAPEPGSVEARIADEATEIVCERINKWLSSLKDKAIYKWGNQ